MNGKSLYGFEVRERDLRRTDGTKSFDIKQLWQRQHEIFGLALLGHSNKEIAKVLNITPDTVSSAVNSTLGREKLSKLRKQRDEGFIDVSKRVAELSEKAMEVYNEIFDSDTVPYKLKKDTADTVLMDLGGHRAPTKIDSRHLNITATPEEIEEFKARGKQAARDSGMLVEVEGETLGTQAETE